ncbi:MAG: nuclear transport factor 2 family protein [Sphingomonas sp.]|nr:nuclear transport factor 2 family protein [Sphingomonas sp.]
MTGSISRTELIAAAEVGEGQTPPMIAADHAALLSSGDPDLAANKRLCYDMYRTLLQAGQVDQTSRFIAPGYIQHNPNVASGAAALEAFIRSSRPERPLEEGVALPLVSIVAERDMVTFLFVRKETDDGGNLYFTTWFDTFRIEDGKIAEHWDPALKSAEMLKFDPNKKRLDG